MCTSTGTTVLLVGLRDRYRVLGLVRGLLVVPELRYRHYMYYCTYSRFSYFYNHFVHYHRYMSTGTVHVYTDWRRTITVVVVQTKPNISIYAYTSPLWPKSGSWRLKSSSMPDFTEPDDPVIVLRVSVDPGHGAGIALGCCAVPSPGAKHLAKYGSTSRKC